MAFALGFTEHWERAASMAEQSLRLYKALSDQWWTARVLVVKATTGWHVDRAEAKQMLEESLALGRALGDRSGDISNALVPLVAISLWQGSFLDAENMARELIAVKREIDSSAEIVAALSLLGLVLFWRGDFVEVESTLGESLAMSSDLGLLRDQAEAVTYLGLAKMHQGEYEDARAHGEWALAVGRELEKDRAVSATPRLLGSVALAFGKNAEARRWLEKGRSLEPESGYDAWHFPVLLGFAALGQGEPFLARGQFGEVLRVASETRNILTLLYALPAMARFLADRDDAEGALELYALASRYTHVANSAWFENVIGKHISAAAATLPPEVVAAAQERGRARDLWATADELSAELEGDADGA
jgi:tetratricopeptide (TPR) repeat protein